MSRLEPSKLAAGIFDVDGVLLASPHERAWREALSGFSDPERFTTELYEAHVSGKPRLSGALAILEHLGVPDTQQLASVYAERKQKILEELIDAGEFTAFPDALRFVRGVQALRWPMAAASSSHNANDMMRAVQLEPGKSLLDVFTVNVCGRDLPRGKPDPAIFLLAAEELKIPSARCFVVEDAPAGIEAARAGGMVAIGIARLNDSNLLQTAGADIVLTSLDEIAMDELAVGRLRHRTT